MTLQLPQLIHIVFEILTWAIVLRVLLTWVKHNPDNPLVRFLIDGTDPILAPFRKLIPRSGMGIDFSPIIAIFVLRMIRHLLLSWL